MDNSQFGSRYAYGAVESAAFNATEPWRMPLAVGRDVGQFVLGRMGWKPAGAEPEEDETQLRHETCCIMKARLRVCFASPTWSKIRWSWSCQSSWRV